MQRFASLAHGLMLMVTAWALTAKAAPPQPDFKALLQQAEVLPSFEAKAFGSECLVQPLSLALTEQHIILKMEFSAKPVEASGSGQRTRERLGMGGGHCYLRYGNTNARLETLAGSHPLLAMFDEQGTQMPAYVNVHRKDPAKIFYFLYDRKGASAAEVAPAAFNGTGADSERGYALESGIMRQSPSESWSRIGNVYWRRQDAAKERGIAAAQPFMSAQGIAEYFALVQKQAPAPAVDFDTLNAIFGAAKPLPDTECTQGLFRLMERMQGSSVGPTSVLEWIDGDIFNGWPKSAADLRAVNAQAPSVPGIQQKLNIVVDKTCSNAYLQLQRTQRTKAYGGGIDEIEVERYAHLRAPLMGDFTVGSVEGRHIRRKPNKTEFHPPFQRTSPAFDFVCTPAFCEKGTLAEVFNSRALSAKDPWAPDVQIKLLALEQQRDLRLAEERRVREAKEKQAAERAQVEAAAALRERQQEERKQQAEERSFKAALNGGDAQAMYLAAGRYERAGETGRAMQLYERVISRFASSSWAVKANDQLNAMNRQSRAESAAQQRERDNRRAAEDNAKEERIHCGVRISQCEDRCPREAGRSSCMAGCAGLCRQF